MNIYTCIYLKTRQFISNFDEQLFAGGFPRENTLHFDIVGFTLNVVVVSYLFLPVIVGPCCLYLELDPAMSLRNYLIGEKNWSQFLNLVAIPLRISSLATCYEMARLFSWLICFMTLALHLLISCVTFLQNKSIRLTIWGRIAIDQYFVGFRALEITVISSSHFTTPMVALVMLIGIIGTVQCNFVALKMHRVIHLPLYLVFPTFGVLLPIIAMIMMPLMIAIFERTKELRRRWQYLLLLCKLKGYVLRKIRATRHIGIYGGLMHNNFYICKKSTQTTYLSVMVYYTITALISITI